MQVALRRCCFSESCRAVVSKIFMFFHSPLWNPFVATPIGWKRDIFSLLSSNAQSKGVLKCLTFNSLAWWHVMFNFCTGQCLVSQKTPGVNFLLWILGCEVASGKTIVPSGRWLSHHGSKVSTLPCGECAQGLGVNKMSWIQWRRVNQWHYSNFMEKDGLFLASYRSLSFAFFFWKSYWAIGKNWTLFCFDAGETCWLPLSQQEI